MSATPANGAAIVTFSTPTSNGGSPITGYLVTATPVAGGLFAAAVEGPHYGAGPGSPIIVGGLTNTVTYVFTVTAQNAVGSSPSSGPSNEVTPVGDAPVIDASPVNISSFGGDTTPGETTGANSRIVAQDERTVTFTLQVTNPEGGTYWIVFTDLPAADFGTIYDHTNAAVTVGTHYDPTEVFTFDPVEIEPVCSLRADDLRRLLHQR